MTTTVEAVSEEFLRRKHERARQKLNNLRTKKGLVDIKYLSREDLRVMF